MIVFKVTDEFSFDNEKYEVITYIVKKQCFFRKTKYVIKHLYPREIPQVIGGLFGLCDNPNFSRKLNKILSDQTNKCKLWIDEHT